PHEISYGRGLFKAVVGDKKFMPYLRFYSFWSLSIAITSPFFAYHELVNMKLDYSFLSLLNVFSSLLTMLFYLLWGKLADRIGGQAVLEFGVFGAFLKTLLWLFMDSGTVYLLYIDTLIGTASWSAINLCLFTTMLELLRGVDVQSYYALLSFANGISALAGSLMGGFLASYLNRYSWTFIGHQFFGIQILFLVTFVLRGISLIFLKRVKTRKVVSVSGMVFNTAAVLANRFAARPRELIEVLIHKNKSRQRKENNDGKTD
ncbi:MAG: MFS transporter, partial [Kosmotogaceae bacterium]|nr:MFS transporter [Kosmotogaceae bacterium]